MERQHRLRPLLDALNCLCQEGLTAALVLLAVHHQRVLSLMACLLRMDEMGLHAASRDHEACRTLSEALSNEEVLTRVRATISGTF